MAKIPLAIDQDTGNSLEASFLLGLSSVEEKKLRSKTWDCIDCKAELRPVIPKKNIIPHWRHKASQDSCKAHESWPHYFFKWKMKEYHQAKLEQKTGDYIADAVIETDRASIYIEGQTDLSDNKPLNEIIAKNLHYSSIGGCPIWFYITTNVSLTPFAMKLMALQGYVPYFNATTEEVTVVQYEEGGEVRKQEIIHLKDFNMIPFIAPPSKKHYAGFSESPEINGNSVWIMGWNP